MDKRLSAMYKKKQQDLFPGSMDLVFHYPDGDRCLSYTKVQWPDDEGNLSGLRYGENPHQQAALYRLADGEFSLDGLVDIRPVKGLSSDLELVKSGKHPGKINIVDIDRALGIMRFLSDSPTVLIMKHNNPCGAARGKNIAEALKKAYEGDSIAAFGGTVLLNRPVDLPSAEYISERYFENVAAPDFEAGTIGKLSGRKNLRVFQIQGMERLEELARRRFIECTALIDGGLVLQNSYDTNILSRKDFCPARQERKGQIWEIDRLPTEQEYRDLLFGWFVESGVSSNSVIFVKDGSCLAIGTGEQDRLGVVQIARDKAIRGRAQLYALDRFGSGLYLQSEETQKQLLTEAEESRPLEGAVMVSDGFFPFRDGIDVALEQGVRAIAEPGGSIRDGEVIEACNQYNAALVFTAERSFRH